MKDYSYPWGTREDGLYDIPWCCTACEDAGHVLPGHFRCNEINPSKWAVAQTALTDSGWKALVRPANPAAAKFFAKLLNPFGSDA